MKTKKLIYSLLASMLVLLSLSACQPAKPGQTETTSSAQSSDIYHIEDYESSEVFDIAKVNLSEALSDICTSYRFTYLSDGLKINGYISVPNSLAETQKPGKCHFSESLRRLRPHCRLVTVQARRRFRGCRPVRRRRPA